MADHLIGFSGFIYVETFQAHMLWPCKRLNDQVPAEIDQVSSFDR